jgi:hypothetical protein
MIQKAAPLSILILSSCALLRFISVITIGYFHGGICEKPVVNPESAGPFAIYAPSALPDIQTYGVPAGSSEAAHATAKHTPALSSAGPSLRPIKLGSTDIRATGSADSMAQDAKKRYL